jgi:thioredoxin 1
MIDELAKDYDGKAVVTKINTQLNRNMLSNLGVRAVPTIIITNNGKEVERFVGIQSIKTFRRALDKLLA